MYNADVDPHPSAQRLSRIEKPFFQVYTGLVLILFAWVTINIIRFPYGVDYGEAPLMDQVRRIEKGDIVYKADINSPPYIIANYPPLYILLVAAAHSSFNSPLFLTARLISMFFSLACGVIIGYLGYSLTRQKTLGALAAAIFWGNPYVSIWSSLARVDMMALAFSLLGLLILLRKKDSTSWMLGACLCFLASAFTRQTYLLAGPLAGLLWLWRLNFRRAILFLLIMGFSTLVIFGTINALTHGGFYMNIIVANINRFELSRLLAMLKQLFILWPIILIVSLATFGYMIYHGIRSRTDEPGVSSNSFLSYGLGAYSIGAIVTAITVGKVGSDVNYFLELMVACALWMVIAIGYLSQVSRVVSGVSMGLISAQLIWVIVGSIPLMNASIGNRWDKLSVYDSLFNTIKLSTQRGIVLSDDYLDMVVLSGQAIYYQPFEYGQLYHAGLWNPDRFATQIEQQEFPLIVIGGDTIHKECCWAPALVNAMETKYQANVSPGLVILSPIK